MKLPVILLVVTVSINVRAATPDDVVAQNYPASATPVDRENGWLARFHRLTRLIVTIADELGMPPG